MANGLLLSRTSYIVRSAITATTQLLFMYLYLERINDDDDDESACDSVQCRF